MMICMRCGDIKDEYWFPVTIKHWLCWCNRCKRTPAGEMPYRQGEIDRRVDS